MEDSESQIDNFLAELKEKSSQESVLLNSLISSIEEYKRLETVYFSSLKALEDMKFKLQNEESESSQLQIKLDELTKHLKEAQEKKLKLTQQVGIYKEIINEYKATTSASESMYKIDDIASAEVKHLTEEIRASKKQTEEMKENHVKSLKEIKERYQKKTLEVRNKAKLSKLMHRFQSRLIANSIKESSISSKTQLQIDINEEDQLSELHRQELITRSKDSIQADKILNQPAEKERSLSIIQYFRYSIIMMIGCVSGSIFFRLAN